MSEQTVLVVEDEVKIGEILVDYLQNNGFKTVHLTSGDEVEPWLKGHTADLMLLDVMLPGKDGLQVCKDVRTFSKMPIIMVTAKVEEIDRILGLELGADDYVCKPFSPREVIARVKAQLRRQQLNGDMLTTGDWWLDEARYKVHYQSAEVSLSTVEFAILKQLMSSPGRIYSRSQLIDSIYPDNRVVSDRTIDSHIKKLRHKLSDELTHQDIIHSVYGVGYKFEILPEDENAS